MVRFFGPRMFTNLLSGLTASLPEPDYYGALRGLPRSFGNEAGQYAVQGKVPTLSKDGYAIATFAGGCFWGTRIRVRMTDRGVLTRVSRARRGCVVQGPSCTTSGSQG